MKRSVLSLLIVGLAGGVQSSAIAHDTTEGNSLVETTQGRAAPEGDIDAQSAGTASQDRASKAVVRDHSTSRTDYDAAIGSAHSNYREAKVQCDRMQGDALRSCIAEANATHNDALTQAHAKWGKQTQMSATHGDSTHHKNNNAEVGGSNDNSATINSTASENRHSAIAAGDAARSMQNGNDYSVAMNNAQSKFREERTKCDRLEGDAMRSCVTDAGRVRSESLAQARTRLDGQAEINGGEEKVKDRSGKDATARDGETPVMDGMGKFTN